MLRSQAHSFDGRRRILNIHLCHTLFEAPSHVATLYEYFLSFFSWDKIDHIVYHTTLNFIGILAYVGNVELSSLYDYWAGETRVANVMSSKRLRTMIHFNDNAQATGSCDLLYKISPIINFSTK